MNSTQTEGQAPFEEMLMKYIYDLYTSYKNPLKENEFKCAICREIYEKARTDEEANAESKELFGVENANVAPNMMVVCDDCFNKMREDKLF